MPNSKGSARAKLVGAIEKVQGDVSSRASHVQRVSMHVATAVAAMTGSVKRAAVLEAVLEARARDAADRHREDLLRRDAGAARPASPARRQARKPQKPMSWGAARHHNQQLKVGRSIKAEEAMREAEGAFELEVSAHGVEEPLKLRFTAEERAHTDVYDLVARRAAKELQWN
eukprot:CAMPEP_0206061844 /NCGR_PEP_ID=MMETSP1466-20131121/55312_1 /ASSEMBLY_ACC=CAM_ASM_001126 /TAXON_ID=44452 /ORGANISM="Pavlova gyrans, Strain CCMP608" /LENGTH=171 /DNA_ID=CAMNT_0053437201 /DNA_START=17 /DNA_END=529 /DNA_ORIENTATION=+